MLYTITRFVRRAREVGRVRWIGVVSDGRVRALVLFPEGSKKNDGHAYEQYNDVDQLECVDEEGNRTMKLDTFGGTATIQGKEREVFYSRGELSISDLDMGEATAFVELLESIGAGQGLRVVEVRGTPRAVPPSDPVAAAVDAARPVEEPTRIGRAAPADTPPPVGRGRREPQVDAAAVETAAAASPAKAPKADKPAGTGRSRRAPRATDDAVDVDAEELDTKADEEEPPKTTAAKDDDHDDDIPFAEDTKPKASANGHANGANGAAKSNVVPIASAKTPGDKLMNARKLRDVLGCLIDDGVTDPKALLKKCEELKAAGHPVLDKIPDLEERIERTLSIMEK